MPRFDFNVDTLVTIEAETGQQALTLIQDAVERLSKLSDHIQSAQVTEVLFAAEVGDDDETTEIGGLSLIGGDR
jgi:hypothetical protein